MTGSRLSKFTLISGCGWLLDVLTLLSLVAMGASFFAANLVGALVGVSLVFLFAQRRVFNATHAGKIRWRLFLPYLAWQAVAILLASALVDLVAILLTPAASALAAWSASAIPAAVIAAGLAKIIVTPLTLYANFLFFGWLAERRISWS